MNIGTVSYALAGIGFFGLFLLLFTSWRGRLKGWLLVVAVFVNASWAAVSAYHAATELDRLGSYYGFFEITRDVAWVVFLLQLFEPFASGKNAAFRVFHFLYPGMILFVGIGLIAYLLPQQLGNIDLGFNLILCGHVSLALCMVLLVVQLFRSTNPENRWATKFLYLGLGGLFAYDLILYASALFFGRMDIHMWYARGLVNAIVVPFIAIAAIRNPQWSLDVFVSRRVVYGSASLFAGILYMLLVVGIGYYIRSYGGTWGIAMQLAFLWGAGLLLLVTLLSERLRVRMKVFFNKHFFSYKYDYREEWLKFIGTLSAGKPSEPLRERAIHAIAEILDSKGGMLWTRDEKGDFFLVATWKTHDELLPMEPGNSSLVEFLNHRQWIIDLDEYRREPDLYGDLSLPHWLQKMRDAWLVVPLIESETIRGFIVLTNPPAKREINWEDHDLLKTAGRQIASYVALLDTTQALMDARQFEAFNRLSAYIVHDLKNISAQLSLVVSNSARHKSNPAFLEDAIRTIENATSKMNHMLVQLRKGAQTTGEISLVNLESTLKDAISARSACKPIPVLTEHDSSLSLRADRNRLTAILEHLIQNAQEATKASGQVEVKVHREGRSAVIEISDDGCGMDERFIRECLFRPFKTTKGNAGMGIGVYESRELVHALGGKIDVISHPGQGTKFFLRLPLADKDFLAQNVNGKDEVALWGISARNY